MSPEKQDIPEDKKRVDRTKAVAHSSEVPVSIVKVEMMEVDDGTAKEQDHVLPTPEEVGESADSNVVKKPLMNSRKRKARARTNKKKNKKPEDWAPITAEIMPPWLTQVVVASEALIKKSRGRKCGKTYFNFQCTTCPFSTIRNCQFINHMRGHETEKKN